jgi:hypothetical protein
MSLIIRLATWTVNQQADTCGTFVSPSTPVVQILPKPHRCHDVDMYSPESVAAIMDRVGVWWAVAGIPMLADVPLRRCHGRRALAVVARS